jgi:hypothetical protein
MKDMQRVTQCVQTGEPGLKSTDASKAWPGSADLPVVDDSEQRFPDAPLLRVCCVLQKDKAGIE